MKKLFAMLMALSMMLTLFAGCNTAPAPESPVSAPEPVSVSEPTPAPTIVEGVVKEASLSKIIVTLADGTDFALDTTGVTDMKVNLGDEVKVEYTGAPGSAVASKVDVTKAAPVPETVTGVVKEVSASMMLLTLEDESELVLLTKDVEGLEALEIKVGDKISATYLMGDTGAVASAVEVVEPAAPDAGSSSGASDAGASSQASSQSSTPAVPANSSSSGSSGSSNNAGGNGGYSELQNYINSIFDYYGNDNGNSNNDSNDNDDEDEDHTPSSKPTETQPEKKPTETTPEPEQEDDVDLDQYAYEVIALANKKRSAAGLSEVSTDSGLMDVAATRAKEISESYSHTMPNGENDSYAGLPDYEWVMCNLGKGQKTPEKIVEAWMKSSEHKRNIMYPEHTAVGAGCYQDDNGTLYWCITYYRDGGKYPNY